MNYQNYRSDGPGPIEMENFHGVGPKGYKRSDNSIEEEVCELLMHTSGLDVENVLISVKEGVVKLAGTTSRRQIKFRIEDVVETVYGVAEVKNEIQVKRT